MSTGLTVLLGAIIGATGAVSAQIISAIFTSRREKAKLEWEKGVKREELNFAQSQRSWSLRRDLYVQYLNAFFPLATNISVTKVPDSETQYAEYLERINRFPPNSAKSLEEFDDRIGPLRTELRLTAPPDVIERSEVLWASYVTTVLTLNSPDRYSLERRRANAKNVLRHWQECSKSMRKDLTQTN